MARLYPDLVEDILIIGALSCGKIPGRKSILEMLTLTPIIGNSIFRSIMQWWHLDEARFTLGMRTAVFNAKIDGMIPAKMLSELRQSNYSMMWQTANWVSRQDNSQHLHEVQQSVSSFIGLNDPVVPADHQLKMLQSLPSSHAVLLKTGHILMIEAPEHFQKAFWAWMTMSKHKRNTR
ncbi:alpha/beta fold hydrolase [Parasulfitobacter algicola]|uniref:Alpha/beta hydrolase n=1 Tax=Parasulfitobacter algicola TaxID=2614809 RepID=A0ABX2IQP4_9RHOB|nr:alpha/beta hydrolase [Sulfitobacter algicola]NSX54341.1 alpha/beta hydrolase [Sulfitobacter algicola]